jgi:hypothetical protein
MEGPKGASGGVCCGGVGGVQAKVQENRSCLTDNISCMQRRSHMMDGSWHWPKLGCGCTY